MLTLRTAVLAVLVAVLASLAPAVAPARADGLQDGDTFPCAWWTDGATRAYSLKQDGTQLATLYHQVTIVDGKRVLTTKAEAGTGDTVQRTGTVVVYDPAGKVLHYELRTPQFVATIDFDSDKLTVHNPGGGEKVIPRGRLPLVDSNNIMALEVVLAATNTAKWTVGKTRKTRVRFAASLAEAEYSITIAAVADGVTSLTDSLGEKISWKPDSGITSVTVGATEFARLDGVEFPDWPIGPTKTFAYKLPANATFSATEVQVPRPQYHTEQSGAGGFALGGTLNIPDKATHGEGPYPAVYFQSGSGLQDRHGFAPGANVDCGTWEVLDAVANAGFVVLRVDDRGCGKSPFGGKEFDPLSITVHNLLGDARACVDYLKGLPEVDDERIFVIGHSEGATIAPMLANRPDSQLRGIVAMAGMGRNLMDVIADQVRWSMEAAGQTPEEIAAGMARQRELMDAVCAGRKPDPELVDAGTWKEFQPVATWMASHYRQDVRRIYREVKVPVLVVQGAADIQVLPDKDARPYARCLAEGACRDCTLRIFDDLDHMFKPCGGRPSNLKMYEEDRRVDPTFIKVLVDWLVAHR
ncbi:MAG: alpha/beta hydrolase family protein [Planctomycetota bacterium]